ncbi:aromatic-ring-hydroxylating dioxygenase subunit beta [Sphingobium sp. YR768]|uniref:aromatic-ring-hydroxylating dioxygenase subunit beta n=1 Tax=Sphingobium sp. YR768 TaxID=1884365 RepID=UPI0008D899A5|nr:aromatic-ring-hydroxylating dioxygenase subunit beta [Sphingobium sp. YR768]SER30150.1 salicylate 5-hydroxylase small subunit [Sphingobium sp. YR768]
MTADPLIQLRIMQFYAAYASCVNDGRYGDWPDFFTETAWYRVVARENYDRDLPLSTLSLKGRPMMKDRIYGIESTIFHAPYYQRHLIGLPMILAASDGRFDVEVNYTVIRTKRDVAAEIYSVGRYIDRIVEVEGVLKFEQKFCVFDNDIIPNSLVYPI